jgi:hypothetical protein
MLPDYPIFKKALEDALTERFRKISKESDFVVAEIREVRVHEGQSSTLIREDGTKDDIEMRRLSEEMSWKCDDILSERSRGRKAPEDDRAQSAPDRLL